MAELGCNVNYLTKDELAHELNIRNVSVGSDSRSEDLRGKLRLSIKLARRGSLKVSDDLAPSSKDEELQLLSTKVSDISRIITSDSKEPLSEASRVRLLGRCNYLLVRLSRLGELGGDVTRLKDTLIKHVTFLDPNVSSSDSEKESGSPPRISSFIYKPENKINFNSLNLKFNGQTCVRSFLMRLEELRVAREISEEQLFNGFPELVTGPALCWFRAHKDGFQTYAELTKALKSDFDSPDFDYRLLQEIRGRTQGKDETMSIFVSIMLGMMSQLSVALPDADKLDIILRNVRPEYSREIILFDVTSLEQLLKLGKKVELIKYRTESFLEPPKQRDSLAPDFNLPTKCNSGSVRSGPVKLVSSVNQRPVPNVVCYRCGKSGHRTKSCRESKDIVCFKCGCRGYKAPECPKCSVPKN